MFDNTSQRRIVAPANVRKSLAFRAPRPVAALALSLTLVTAFMGFAMVIPDEAAAAASTGRVEAQPVACNGGGSDYWGSPYDYAMFFYPPKVYPATGLTSQAVAWRPIIQVWNGLTLTWVDATYPGNWSGWARATSTVPAVYRSPVLNSLGMLFWDTSQEIFRSDGNSNTDYFRLQYYVAYQWSSGAITYGRFTNSTAWQYGGLYQGTSSGAPAPWCVFK